MKIQIIFLLLITKVFCQNIDVLKASDTIYIELNSSQIREFKNFTIQYHNIKSASEYTIISRNKDYVYFLTENIGSLSKENFKVCNLRKFKKINNDKIINLEFIDKFDLFKLFLEKIKFEKKNIFIIDEGLKKYRKVLKKAKKFDNRKIIM